MWKTLLGFFGAGGGSEAETRKPRARKARAGKKRSAAKTAVRVGTKLGVTASRPPKTKAKAKRRSGSRKPKFVWPTEPQKASRRRSKPVVTDGQLGDDPNWSQQTQPLL